MMNEAGNFIENKNFHSKYTFLHDVSVFNFKMSE